VSQKAREDVPDYASEFEKEVKVREDAFHAFLSLFQKYGILQGERTLDDLTLSDWKTLVIGLAVSHREPGFEIILPGRPRKVEEHERLCSRMEKLTETGLTQRDAAKTVAEELEMEPKTVESTYSRLKKEGYNVPEYMKRYMRISKSIRPYHEIAADIAPETPFPRPMAKWGVRSETI
jgi:hypothetical protein